MPTRRDARLGAPAYQLGGADFDVAFVRARHKIVRFALEPSYDNTLLRQAAALSTAQVKDRRARELEPRDEVVVVLGDRASVTKAFADAGIDGVKLVEREYK